jgi:DNA-binding GntR family transcriptional regulator
MWYRSRTRSVRARRTSWQHGILIVTSVYTAPHAITGLSRSERVHGELKHRLLVGEFPLNVRIGEQRLADLLDVSRTPVREALLRLLGEGLVCRAPDGGYYPVAPDVVVAHHLYEVRRGLELQALQRPAGMGIRHDLSPLLELQEDWQAAAEDAQEPSPSFVLLDESFHVRLAEAAGNPTLVDLLRQVNERIRVVRMLDFLDVERIVATIEEHLGIVEAVIEGDIAEAEKRFCSHLDRSVSVVDQRVSAALVRMATAPRADWPDAAGA